MNYVKQSLNVYTVMLAVSFIALLAGAIILLVELRKWGNFPFESPWDTSKVQPVVKLEAQPSTLGLLSRRV